MVKPERQHEFDTWHVPGRTPLIAYSQVVMRQIVDDVGAGLQRHGGEAVGGILFGHADDGEVRITAYRAIPRSRRAPDFRLTDDEETILQHMLQTANNDPDLRKLVPVGLYFSKLDEGVALSAEAIELWNRQFPFRWQVALVLRPQPGAATRAGFFFRPDKGPGRFDASMREFDLIPGAVPEFDAPDDPLDRPPPGPEPPAELFSVPTERTPSRVGWYAAAGLGLIALVGGGAWYASRPKAVAKTEPAGPVVRVSDQDGYLTVAWDPNSRAIQAIQRPYLEIADGDRRSNLPLNGTMLRAGRWSVARTTDEVRIRLTSLDERSMATVVESLRFIAPVAQPASADPANDELFKEQQEMDRLQTMVEGRSNRNAKLQERLDALGERLTAGGAAKPAPAKPEPTKPEPAKPEVAVAPPPPAIQPSVVRPPEPEPPPALEPPLYTGPRAGRLIWTGSLAPNSTLTIDGRRASTGSVTAALPGVPVRVSAYPAEIAGGGLSVFTATARGAEGRSAQTGWMNTAFVADAARARDVLIAEGPTMASPARMVLRSGERPVTAVLVEWQVAQ
jgi:hypothetical protein